MEQAVGEGQGYLRDLPSYLGPDGLSLSPSGFSDKSKISLWFIVESTEARYILWLKYEKPENEGGNETKCTI
jgi:hypothetical protein